MMRTLTPEESNKLTRKEYLDWLCACHDETQRELKVWKARIDNFHKQGDEQ